MIKPGFFAVSVFISLRPHQLDALCSVISQNTGTKSDFSATFTQKLEEIANEFEGVEKSFAIQAGREIRIMIKPDVVNDDGMVMVAKDIVKRIENELEYPGQIKVSLIRETRAVDYAK